MANNPGNPLHKEGYLLRERYRITRYIGGGAWGQTYLAEDQNNHNCQCVVKLLYLHFPSPESVDKGINDFKKEAKTLERLGSHNQIPQFIDDFEENQEFYIVQEFINGTNLEKVISSSSPWSETQVILFLEDVLKVLSYIHQNGAIHRDIKPANLIRRYPDGKIAIVDFGGVKEIANSLSDSGQGQSLSFGTAGYMAPGTKGYMAPEQTAGNPQYNSDIYALGITAIRAITGTSPGSFQRNSQGEISCQMMTEKQLSQSLVNILDKMVLSDFRDRYQSASDILEELNKLNNPLQQTNSTAGETPTAQELLKSSNSKKIPIRFNTRLFLSIVVVVAILFGLVRWVNNVRLDRIFNEANNLANSGENEKAISLYKQVLKENPNDYEALINKASVLIKSRQDQDRQESLDACEKAIQIKPDEGKAWNCKALVLQALGKYDEAIEPHNYAIKLSPNSADFRNNRGYTQFLLHKYDFALADFNIAIRLDQNYLIAWYNKGKALYELGQTLNQPQKYVDSIAAFDRAINLNQSYYHAWIGRGNALRKLKPDDEEALIAYEQATRLAPKDYEAWYYRGLMLEHLGRYNQALDSYNQAIQIEPKNIAAIEARQRLQRKIRGLNPTQIN